MMVPLLESWARISSGSEDLAGLQEMLLAIKEAFAPIGGKMQEIPLPPRQRIGSNGEIIKSPLGKALSIIKHPNAPVRVFFGGHMDVAVPGWETERLDEHTLKGPGVADMKGGLVVMLKALEALEESPDAGKIGWEVLINPDEEIGSVGSRALFADIAQRNQVGLIFEPTLPNGKLAGARKGSANFTAVARGKAAHAGRDFFDGKNAISALARFIVRAEDLTDVKKETTVNVGQIEGGGPVNIVPEFAICRLNIRMKEGMDDLKAKLEQIAKDEGVTLYQDSERPPKPFDDNTHHFFELLQSCAKELGLELGWEPTGGVCDGNNLSAAGLPTIDTLGVVGGKIHTTEEYVHLPSLQEKADLTAAFLKKLITVEVPQC